MVGNRHEKETLLRGQVCSVFLHCLEAQGAAPCLVSPSCVEHMGQGSFLLLLAG